MTIRVSYKNDNTCRFREHCSQIQVLESIYRLARARGSSILRRGVLSHYRKRTRARNLHAKVDAFRFTPLMRCLIRKTKVKRTVKGSKKEGNRISTFVFFFFLVSFVGFSFLTKQVQLSKHITEKNSKTPQHLQMSCLAELEENE